MVNARNDLNFGLKPAAPAPAAEWRVSEGLIPYEAALAAMEARVAAILAGTAPELIWLLEHPPLYTSGTSARPEELLEARFPIYATGRGGQFTYHGPGQRVVYLLLDLNRRAPDVRRYVSTLEEWIIRTLAEFKLRGERREDRVGVWVSRPEKGQGFEDKIAAIGIRLKRWVSLHGIALNVDCDLTHFSGIRPCGIADARFGVTSLVDLGLPVSMTDVDLALRRQFAPLFGASEPVAGTPVELAATV